MAIGRSENMRRIRSKDTAPEVAVRRLIRDLGFAGYRLHRKDLPGKPDIAFVGRKRAVLVHGCFWHGHSCHEGLRRPKSNTEYWTGKIAANVERDAAHFQKLRALGWSELVVWECELRDPKNLIGCLTSFLAKDAVAKGRATK